MAEIVLKAEISPMLFLDLEEMGDSLESAVESGLLSEEEASRVIADFINSKLPSYIEFTEVKA